MSAATSTSKAPRSAPAVTAETTGLSMRARVGDEIVVRGTGSGVVTRDGEIVGVHHPDGSPPYDVRWSDTGRVTLYFPGPDAHLKHLAPGD
ncbi:MULTISPECIES: DUF1918 domain-containing protein [unclassified Streptomyces]|uniref:DUF1918 domain-containing protein n=1 Tax=unclassified Streptomyces TaxID=2593676 RepID=UPI003D7218B6